MDLKKSPQIAATVLLSNKNNSICIRSMNIKPTTMNPTNFYSSYNHPNIHGIRCENTVPCIHICL